MTPLSLLGVSVLLLCAPTAAAVSLNVSPNLQQFFSDDSVSLSCVVGAQAGGQAVKRTAGGQTDLCGSGFGTFDGSSCTVSGLSPSDSGVYWCEAACEQMSQQVNISVCPRNDFARCPFILEIPALPVTAGSEVTLRCRNKDGSTHAVYFFRNGVHIRDTPMQRVKVEEFSVSKVQQSDEGLYWCSTDLLGPSHRSWLIVRAPPAPPPPPSVSLVRLICLLVVVCLFCICTVLMVLMCCSRKTGNKSPVAMEMTQCFGEYDDIAAGISTEHDF
ncbi:uncharacterized protein LOC118284989 isoform X1 [Scophthalmus maximus]|uniref:uncharacterized protein LOC118284989 isoform X1 n=1 Tax=Scophthalmus maximus TaxID=52904 RepID=UPI001FA8F144|nr:uncharacterized protein LOC118284989 isoform X1 [Scophthalmus maximus]